MIIKIKRAEFIAGFKKSLILFIVMFALTELLGNIGYVLTAVFVSASRLIFPGYFKDLSWSFIIGAYLALLLFGIIGGIFYP